jgi:hypothetical protein
MHNERGWDGAGRLADREKVGGMEARCTAAPAREGWHRWLGELLRWAGLLLDLPTRKNGIWRELSPLAVGGEK